MGPIIHLFTEALNGILVSFPVAVIKYPGKNNLREEGFILFHS